MALKLVGLAWMGGKFLSSFKLYFVSLIKKKKKRRYSASECSKSLKSSFRKSMLISESGLFFMSLGVSGL